MLHNLNYIYGVEFPSKLLEVYSEVLAFVIIGTYIVLNIELLSSFPLTITAGHIKSISKFSKETVTLSGYFTICKQTPLKPPNNVNPAPSFESRTLTPDSTKKFEITVNDSGTIVAKGV